MLFTRFPFFSLILADVVGIPVSQQVTKGAISEPGQHGRKLHSSPAWRPSNFYNESSIAHFMVLKEGSGSKDER